ncbi:nucleotidyltransferase family protein [uncultured Microbacterium sp.]|uniref:nucleotidyltransferase family protein n=1 Tax=uncultured Microbacterium sp. TaxID=191216 RepID=UPI0028D50D4D|nr:nucleotidyltransferase family protein [uncultured Microbacterium sp.]
MDREILLSADGSQPLPSVVALQLDEALELCTAWLHSIAAKHEIRLLVLKGDALARQSLRATRTSSDVDVLIEPHRFDDFTQILTAAGWREYELSFAAEQFTFHSRTFHRRGWPNSVDVHAYWPGFLAPAADAFEALWVRRASLEFAHHPCDVPDRIAHALILALHSLRSSQAQLRHKTELASVLDLELDDREKLDAAAFIRATQSAAPLSDVIRHLGIDVEISAAEWRSAEAMQWRRKVRETEGRARFWIEGLRRAAWLDKPGMLRKAIWPTRRDMLLEHPDVMDRVGPMLSARARRLGRGIRQIVRLSSHRSD